jgi:hypothetical protein
VEHGWCNWGAAHACKLGVCYDVIWLRCLKAASAIICLAYSAAISPGGRPREEGSRANRTAATASTVSGEILDAWAYRSAPKPRASAVSCAASNSAPSVVMVIGRNYVGATSLGREREKKSTGTVRMVGKYDQYARDVMRSTFGDRWQEVTEATIFSFGEGAGYGQVDGVIDGAVAVEFGVGSPKQIRAAVLEPVLHPLEGKMLVLIDTPGHATQSSVVQAGRIMGALGSSGVVVRLPNNDLANRPETRNQVACILSKYMGEPERHVVRLFDAADMAETLTFS